MNISIFGAASSRIDQKYKEAAYEVGKALADAGLVLVFGGGDAGVMGAAARGCLDHDGYIIGILPEFFKEGDYEELFAQSHETVYTRDIAERISLMEERSDGFLVLPGGIGTYEEFFKVLVSVSLDQHQKPLAVFNVDGYFDPLRKMLESGVEKGFIYPDRMDMFRVFDEHEIPEMIAYVSQQ